MAAFFQYSIISLTVIIRIQIAFAFKCITWSVSRDEMYFTYRTGDFSKSVTFKDSGGNVKTICSFEQSSYYCQPIPTFIVIKPNIKKREIIFTIEDYKSMDLDGTWSVSQGGNTFSTIVSLSNGISQSTDVHMTGQIDIFKVTVRCFACRAPHGYNAEFLINGISEDSITLNYETGKCTHQLGECRPGICSCSRSGNEFSRSFALRDAKTPVNFSCDMMFVDRITSLRFSKYATVFYDGTEIHYEEPITDIERSSNEHPDKNNTKKENDDMDFKGTLVGIVTSVVTVLIIAVVVLVLYQKSRRKKNTHSTQDADDMVVDLLEHGETEHACLNISQTCVNVQSIQEELNPQMNIQLEACVTGNENTHSDKIVQTSDDELFRPVNNQVQECRKENEKTHADKTVQTAEEEHIIDHSISKQRQTSPERPYDVVFINCDVDIERKWVERVVEMLEDTYDLVCGFKGRDFLEMDYSFQFIQKHTPVVVTFSEMSCRMQPEIRRMENIDRLVAVMVEECSPPIFSFNMKCVDATLEEEQWVKQLLTALHYQKYVET